MQEEAGGTGALGGATPTPYMQPGEVGNAVGQEGGAPMQGQPALPMGQA